MPLLCPHCTTSADPGERFCSSCGHNFVHWLPGFVIPDGTAPVSGLTVRGAKVNCLCYGTASFFDPVAEVMEQRFHCGRYPERLDCDGCRVCPHCGEEWCVCGCLAIRIDVKVAGTVVETVPVRERVGRLHSEEFVHLFVYGA